MDITDKVPNEIWIEIFDRLPSLKDQLNVERVNKRFQSCILKLFEMKPLSLVIDNSTTGCYGYVNDALIRRLDQRLEAVQMLANKAKLQSIKSNCSLLWTGFELISSALINSKTRCLDKVTRFEFTGFIADRAPLLEVLTKCPKLSCFKMGRGTYVQPDFNLVSALHNKALTHLELILGEFPHEQLVGLLQSLQPNTLKSVKFDSWRMMLEPAALIDTLRMDAWAALEEIELIFFVAEVRLSDLFDSLPRLPKLRKCKIELHHAIKPDNQYVSALTSLFYNSQIEARIVASDCNNLVRDFTSGCQFVNAIRQVQEHHPMLEIDFEMGDGSSRSLLKMSLDQASFQTPLSVRPCHCLDCGSFYPTLLYKLHSMANAQVSAQLQVGSLDRCKIDNVVFDLNSVAHGLKRYEALGVEKNQLQAKITFLSKPDQRRFNVTVECRRCLSNRCRKCLERMLNATRDPFDTGVEYFEIFLSTIQSTPDTIDAFALAQPQLKSSISQSQLHFSEAVSGGSASRVETAHELQKRVALRSETLEKLRQLDRSMQSKHQQIVAVERSLDQRRWTKDRIERQMNHAKRQEQDTNPDKCDKMTGLWRVFSFVCYSEMGRFEKQYRKEYDRAAERFAEEQRRFERVKKEFEDLHQQMRQMQTKMRNNEHEIWVLEGESHKLAASLHEMETVLEYVTVVASRTNTTTNEFDLQVISLQQITIKIATVLQHMGTDSRLYEQLSSIDLEALNEKFEKIMEIIHYQTDECDFFLY